MIIHRITHYVSRIFFIILLSFLAGEWGNVVLAQSSITAEVDRTRLSTDEQLSLTVTISGDLVGIPRPDLSNLVNFAVVGSSTSTQISVINGQMTSRGIFSYRLQPLKEGNLVIPPISVIIDGLTYQTEPIDIEVVAGLTPTLPSTPPPVAAEAPSALEGQPLFIEAEVDNPTPYLGQQITYIFRFYQAVEPIHPFGRPDYQPPPFTNFWGQIVLSQPHYSTSIAGYDYSVTEIHTALFPANPGPLTIAPAKLIIPGDLFNPDVVLETEPVAIEVQSLPEGAPPDFSGAVGQFEIRANLSTPEGKVDEPVTLILEIEGAGNIEVLNEPPLPELPNWRMFDSQTSTRVEVQEDVVYGTRRFQRLIVPGQPGDTTFPPISFSYYDPRAGEYRIIETDPIPITVQPGEAEFPPEVTAGSDKQPVELVTSDIRHIKPVPPSLESAAGSLLGHPLYWTFWILPVLIAGGVWVWQGRRQRLLIDTAYARSQRARRVAQKILVGASQSGVDSYAAAHRALLGYLSDKLNRPTVGLTTNDLIDSLRQQQLDPTVIERVQMILARIEIGRFAPIEETAAQSLIAETQRLINNLEKSFGGRR